MLLLKDAVIVFITHFSKADCVLVSELGFSSPWGSWAWHAHGLFCLTQLACRASVKIPSNALWHQISLSPPPVLPRQLWFHPPGRCWLWSFLWKCECPSLSNGRRADLQIWWSRCNPFQMHEGEEYCCYIKEIDFGLQVCTGKSRYNREHTVNLFFFPHGRHYWIRSRHLAGRIACPETSSMGKWWANYSRAEFGYGQTLKKDKAA